MQTEGKKVPLQQASLTIPAGHDLKGLSFLIRSEDSTAWWRDGEILHTSPAIHDDLHGKDMVTRLHITDASNLHNGIQKLQIKPDSVEVQTYHCWSTL